MDSLARRREILNDKSAMFSVLPNELLYMDVEPLYWW